MTRLSPSGPEFPNAPDQAITAVAQGLADGVGEAYAPAAPPTSDNSRMTYAAIGEWTATADTEIDFYWNVNTAAAAGTVTAVVQVDTGAGFASVNTTQKIATLGTTNGGKAGLALSAGDKVRLFLTANGAAGSVTTNNSWFGPQRVGL